MVRDSTVDTGYTVVSNWTAYRYNSIPSGAICYIQSLSAGGITPEIEKILVCHVSSFDVARYLIFVKLIDTNDCFQRQNCPQFCALQEICSHWKNLQYGEYRN